ncbi:MULTISPECIES: 23S rRNA (guanosine(2251)-2'-O)-methyltransferase RlmB [Thermodesulfovibrio]|jgi:23S rRNA (guanosine2251-2'-O)-methyltransferase|uniref:23S rRNA (guanosine(2251)-2'-O)-methyltransferase RlmB n=1 Tax=Thermodesulfovibrio TaxID=28261 RepID=UPI00261B96D2|nr:23S rRNA (guanosine(2251)-2'-O)-methyltransferase RlmB [Thermodesulfovibrio sp.]
MESKNLIYIYGVNPVEEAFKESNVIKEIYVSKDRAQRLSKILELAEKNSIPVKLVDKFFLDKTVNGVHQGIVAKVKSKKTISIEDALIIPEKMNEPALFLILDLIEDPQNFGAILRVADATGVHAVFYQKKRSAGLVPSVWKTSAGAIWHVNLVEVNNIKYAIRELKENDIAVIATDAKEGDILWNFDFKKPVAIVLGSEGKGVRHTVGKLSNILLKIPMKGKISSLNVSTAAAVILFEALRQRGLLVK